MSEYLHNGGPSLGVLVTHLGTKVYDGERKSIKCIVITNPSSKPMYLALQNSADGVTCPHTVGTGIYLGPNGGSYEINSTNRCTCEIWAIHDDAANAHNMCVQICG